MWQGIFVILTILIVGFFLIAIILPGNNFFQRADSTNEDKKGVTVEDIAKDPVIYKGLTVEITGTVSDWRTKRAFIVTSSKGFGISDAVLVIRRDEFRLPRNTPPGQLALGENADVIVRGTVKEFDTVSVERELRVDLIEDEFLDWNNRSVIVAESVKKH